MTNLADPVGSGEPTLGSSATDVPLMAPSLTFVTGTRFGDELFATPQPSKMALNVETWTYGAVGHATAPSPCASIPEPFAASLASGRFESGELSGVASPPPSLAPDSLASDVVPSPPPPLASDVVPSPPPPSEPPDGPGPLSSLEQACKIAGARNAKARIRFAAAMKFTSLLRGRSLGRGEPVKQWCSHQGAWSVGLRTMPAPGARDRSRAVRRRDARSIVVPQ